MLLPEFSGQGQDIRSWLQRVELTYKVPPKVMTLIAVGKFTDQAKTWYHSKPQYILLDWQGLKYEMRRMFGSRPDKVARMKRFEGRKWRKGEKT